MGNELPHWNDCGDRLLRHVLDTGWSPFRVGTLVRLPLALILDP